jgi:uncharacterized integral membrane protein
MIDINDIKKGVLTGTLNIESIKKALDITKDGKLNKDDLIEFSKWFLKSLVTVLAVVFAFNSDQIIYAFQTWTFSTELINGTIYSGIASGLIALFKQKLTSIQSENNSDIKVMEQEFLAKEVTYKLTISNLEEENKQLKDNQRLLEYQKAIELLQLDLKLAEKDLSIASKNAISKLYIAKDDINSNL